MKTQILKCLVAAPLIISFVGCAELPGNRKTQGAVIGGAAGAATGAAVGGKNRVLGAIIGGVLGAGGGYVIAAKTDKIDNKDVDAATEASRKAESSPATAEQARSATTADVNSDGFVTMDEVVALKQAGLSEDVMIQRLQMTDQVFELTRDQQNYLRQQGISDRVINEMIRSKKSNVQVGGKRRGDVIGKGNSTTTP